MALLSVLLLFSAQSAHQNIITNPGFDPGSGVTTSPNGYNLIGDAKWVQAGYLDEVTTPGIALSAKGEAGSIDQLVKGIDPGRGRWLRFQFRGRAEDGFVLKNEHLFIKFEFFGKEGTVSLDSAERLIYREIVKDRKDFTANGNKGQTGAAVWRTYEFEELMPFEEVDSLKVTVGFKGGAATAGSYNSFFVDDFSLTQAQSSSRGLAVPKGKGENPHATVDLNGCISLGGRWYYQPAANEKDLLGPNQELTAKLTINESNADRLLYKDDPIQTPFAGNMTSVLRAGFLDSSGQVTSKDRDLPDNVVIEFTPGQKDMVVYAKNIPNHPTAKFPDTYGSQGYDPNSIQEQANVFRLPLAPQRADKPIAMTKDNGNRALQMGPVGFAVNGVVFFNPFDAGMQDAASIMDRCCGHPSPDNSYHYHKYPICVNTPFVDKGKGHSPVIGFAFDGFPVYGPYESAGVMAKDSSSNPLSDFNGHEDSIRGWHYHATPGKFPYLIGGYWGKVDRRNFGRGPG